MLPCMYDTQVAHKWSGNDLRSKSLLQAINNNTPPNPHYIIVIFLYALSPEVWGAARYLIRQEKTQHGQAHTA